MCKTTLTPSTAISTPNTSGNVPPSPVRKGWLSKLQLFARRSGTQQPQKRVREIRSVSFADQPDVYEVPSLDDFSYADVVAIWYSRKDFQNMRDESNRLILNLETTKDCGTALSKDGCVTDSQEDDDDDDDASTENSNTVRGLEYRCPLSLKRKRHSIQQVLLEQQRQESEGVKDPEYIANVYSLHSFKCKELAIAIGKQDEEEVKHYLEITAAAVVNHSSQKESRLSPILSSRKRRTSILSKRRQAKRIEIAV